MGTIITGTKYASSFFWFYFYGAHKRQLELYLTCKNVFAMELPKRRAV
jgi:hypothetical protein